MAKLQIKCPTCNKVATTVSEVDMGIMGIMRTYSCGHGVIVDKLIGADADTLDITSLDGKRLFPYQLDGARFIEAANGRVGIFDEMALGKTVQSLAFITAHPEARPFLGFVKARLKRQWCKEGVRWGDLVIQVLDGTKEELLPGFDGYLVSYDSSWRMGTLAKKIKLPGMKKADIIYEPIEGKTLADQAAKCKVKTVILDECQLIKNMDSQRTKTVQNVCRRDGIDNIIALSGTPIKNNAAEYFPVLNLLRPDKFPNKNQYLMKWVDTYWNGYSTKSGGLQNPKAFQEYTKDFIIRRTRAEVLPDLPSIFRQYHFCDLGEMVEEEYQKTVKEFQDFYAEGPGGNAFAFQSNLLAYLSKMRHLTGLSKIDPVCDLAEEFIMSTDRKLAIFYHHVDVGATLQYKLSEMSKEWPAEWGKEILQVLDAKTSDDVINQWRSPDYRICLFSTLASGEGLNLQFCSDCIMVERQWNPANEEQAEARFPRPGQTADKINATYITAVGTVDEFFSELVEKKREIVGKTLDGKAAKWDETSLIKELAEILAQKGGKKWGW
jgi:SNF2 family DNA or RNA helicase